MRLSLILLVLASVGCEETTGDEGTRGGFLSWLGDRAQRLEPYALDDLPRNRPPGAEVDCDREALERYEGEHLRYSRPLSVHPAFTERLKQLEQIVRELAEERYGRAPRRVLHVGAFACRPVRGRDERLSEHALGNALDLTGFTFGRWRASEGEERTPENSAAEPQPPPQDLRRPFRVTIREHWETEVEDEQVHREFLRALARRLEEERVFRSLIGPSQQGHAGHLHLGMPPWRYVRL